ncbi:hypothetical protein [Brevundimonas sp. M20]|uniref:hypothetical protein n=1 Tax=Brevundimonas sp. M20 TaxID=2591463 RepID=UPI0011470B4C|nr:hypothetical protein [Brevundimonas sp. M20]QDH74663.1 hypothetical protein FKQ52_15355 [Brevundimonas sp. M20]
MKILLAASAVALFVAAPTLSGAAAPQTSPQYRQCVVQNMQACYPRDGNENIYRPSPETPEGIAFEACAAAVRADCAALYPN